MLPPTNDVYTTKAVKSPKLSNPDFINPTPYHTTKMIVPKRQNNIKDINKPLTLPLPTDSKTSLCKLCLYRSLSNHSLANDFTVEIPAKVSCTMVLVSASWSCAFLYCFRIYLPKTTANKTTSGTTDNMIRVSFTDRNKIKPIPITRVRIPRMISANMDETAS